MQGMIGHHQQAVEMVALIPTHSTRADMQLLGKRIDLSQQDEMKMMRRWLEVRGKEIPGEHAMHMHGATLMPGMLTAEEMERLAAAKGSEFDRLFLEGMMKHHGGAITMVNELFATPGAGQEVEIFSFASDVDADQRMEIDRMGAMLNAILKRASAMRSSAARCLYLLVLILCLAIGGAAQQVPRSAPSTRASG